MEVNCTEPSSSVRVPCFLGSFLMSHYLSGATTFSIATLSMTTLSIKTFSTKTLSIMIFSITIKKCNTPHDIQRKNKQNATLSILTNIIMS